MLTLHLCAVAFWFGVVGCEFVVERSRAESEAHGFAVARNHFWIDVLLEVPAASTVLVTGLLLLGRAEWTLPLVSKVIAGIVAVCVNIICLIPVTFRRQAADEGRLQDVIRHSRTIDQISALGVPAGVLALVLGVGFGAG